MSILSINTDLSGKVDVNPNVFYIKTNDSLNELTTAGYFTGIINQGFKINTNSIIHSLYGENSDLYSLLTISVSNGVATAVAWINPGNISFPVVDGNISVFDGTQGRFKDTGIMNQRILTSAINSPDVSIDLISFDVTCSAAALASGGMVTLINSSGSKNYRIRSLQIQRDGTNFSGGGGNRSAVVNNGPFVYYLIPEDTLKTLVNAEWGSTDLSYPLTGSLNSPLGAGVDLVFQYAAGTTDYTAGSIVVSGIAQRIA